jgi:membrane associated rhomboid family serine protease
MNAPLVTVWLVILNSVVWAAQLVLGDRPLLRYALWPLGEHLLPLADGRSLAVGFSPYQLLSYGFLHADLLHLAVNLAGLVLFGPMIERCMGAAHFVFYYAACLVAGALAQLVFLADTSTAVATIGASGAVFGLLVAAALLYPQRQIVLFPLPLRLSTRAVALILGAGALLHGALGSNAGVAHFVHLGGMAGGLLLVQYWRGRLPLKPARFLEP